MSGTNPSNPTPQNAIWSAPIPQAVLGLNATMTYGSAFQCSVPANFQVNVGGNYQLVVDPVGFMKAFPTEAEGGDPASVLEFPAVLDPIFGSGVLGNVQITLGTSAQMTLGKSYNIDLGPKKNDVKTDSFTACKPIQRGLGTAMLFATLAYVVAYGALPTDLERAILTVTYQGLIQISVSVMMLAENANQLGYCSARKLLNQALFGTSVPDTSPEFMLLGLAELALAAAIIVPPILEGVGEKYLDDAKAQQ
jgi:hypothetical protein